jgi:hypothetical protein
VEKNQQKPKPINTPQSALKWLRDSMRGVNKTGKVTDYSDFLKDTTKNIKRKLPGQVLLFKYKPSTRTRIFDRYPLVLVTGIGGGGFYGINLHYIPPKDRFKMIMLMNTLMLNPKETDPHRIRIKIMSILNKKIFAKYTGVVFNQYNVSNIIGKPKITTPEEWTQFAFLPMFKGISPSKLYSEILKETRN